MFLLDTNVLVYAFDPSEPHKHRVAQDLLKKAATQGDGAISSQVVQEFCSVILKKFANIILATDLGPIMDEIMLPLWRHLPNADFYKHAIYLSQDKRLGFYDALIVQAAIDLDCKTLYSEDLQDGQAFGDLFIVNPFK